MVKQEINIGKCGRIINVNDKATVTVVSNLKGKSVTIVDGKVMVDGKPLDEYQEQTGDRFEINITIEGNCSSVEDCDKVEVKGSCGSVKTMSGSVHCGDVTGSVSTMSGSVHCGHIGGNVSTMSGSIHHE